MSGSDHSRQKEGLTRREFFKAAGIALPALAGSGCAFLSGCHPGGEAFPPSGGEARQVFMAGVAAGSGDEAVETAIRDVIEATTDFSWLSRGDSVFIKVSSNTERLYPASTLPLAVTVMARVFFEKGAGRVLAGDKSGVATVHVGPDFQRGSTRKAMSQNCLHAAIEAGGAEPYYYEEDGYDSYFEADPPEVSHWRSGLMLPGVIREVDHIVLLPRLSTHAIAGVTFALKIGVGWLRDDTRLEMHRDAASIFEKIAEINAVPAIRSKLRLALTAGTAGLTTFGPDFGYRADPPVGLVFASTCPAAHDALATAMIQHLREHHTPPAAFLLDLYPGLANLSNQLVVTFGWSLGEGVHTETFSTPQVGSPWSNPTIALGTHLFGTDPGRIEIVNLEESVPDALEKYLVEHASIDFSHEKTRNATKYHKKIEYIFS